MEELWNIMASDPKLKRRFEVKTEPAKFDKEVYDIYSRYNKVIHN
jgi:arginyl-tRNA--protein-N-Asp/Glu arginylyltransferase